MSVRGSRIGIGEQDKIILKPELAKHNQDFINSQPVQLYLIQVMQLFFYFLLNRATLAIISLCAASGPSHPSILTHLPSSKSL